MLRPCLANLRQQLLKGRRGINTLQWWGASGLAALRAQLLKREEELRRREQEDTERRRAERLAEQLRK
ncbi:hypothetical protein ACSLOG_27405, partial [Escherichia coli]|uniref:hypothetical protein n=1 Tax=Escherichia coli TaxID=562 RepID=UPI003EE1F3C4